MHCVLRLETRTNFSADVFVTIPTIYLFFKETKQKSLEEIDLLFGGRTLGALDNDLSVKEAEMADSRGDATEVENASKHRPE